MKRCESLRGHLCSVFNGLFVALQELLSRVCVKLFFVVSVFLRRSRAGKFSFRREANGTEGAGKVCEGTCR